MKYLLLAKSNIRKTKGLTIGLIFLIAIAADFFSVFLLLNTDFSKNAYRQAEKLNTEDAYITVIGDVSYVDDDYINSIINDDVLDFEINDNLTTVSDLPYGDGAITAYINVSNEDMFNNKIGKFEILTEDKDINNNYIYLPYQFNVGGKFSIGDDFKFNFLSAEYNLKIKGFVNTITFGSNNVGAYQLIVSEDAYQKIKKDTDNKANSKLIKFIFKDNVNVDKYLNKTMDKILNDYPNSQISSNTLDVAINGRTFLANIFGALLLIVCVVVIIIVILMLTNNITNFIRENIKTLGALKAIGYTSKDTSLAFIIQFLIIAIIGCGLGTIGSIFMMRLISSIMIMQSAIPYTPHISIVNVLLSFVLLLAIVLLTLLVALRKVKKIEPIVALRESDLDNAKKRNILPLEKSNISLNINLALKTAFNNITQNIVTFIVVFFLIFMNTLSLILYQNFSVNPKFSIMTFEICDAIVGTDSDKDLDMYNYLNNLDEVENIRLIANSQVVADDVKLLTYIIDDTSKVKNDELVYDGNFPKKKEEIAVSGQFAEKYGYEIGDKITLKSGKNEETYIISGLIQTLNNAGKELIILKDAADQFIGMEYDKSYYFEVKDGADVKDLLSKVKEEKGNAVKNTIDFLETADGALGTFKTISFAVVVLVNVINVLIILLVLYMLIKTLINKKMKEYGILKAIGFTSKNIVLQNSISFLPTIILSVIISSIISSLTMNKIIAIILYSFGIMKLTFEVPIILVIVFGLIFIIISFMISVLVSHKIKKIEPYKLLIGE